MVHMTISTIGIRFFAECQMFFLGHSVKKYLPRGALGKVILLVTTTFTENRTLGRGRRHSAKTTLPNAKHSANGDTRQRAISSHLYLMAVNFAECRSLAIDKEASLSSVYLRHSAKYIFIFFFSQPNFFYYIPTLCRPASSILA
jgi:hypothetical protein